jgi:hypothetical protein
LISNYLQHYIAADYATSFATIQRPRPKKRVPRDGDRIFAKGDRARGTQATRIIKIILNDGFSQQIEVARVKYGEIELMKTVC